MKFKTLLACCFIALHLTAKPCFIDQAQDERDVYTQPEFYNYLDTIAPIIQDCPAQRVIVKDSSDNDPGLWNASYWTDLDSGLHNLADGPIDLKIKITDSCRSSIDAFLFFDLDGDGIQETVVHPTDPNPFPGTIRFNNAFNPGYNGGELREFDNRPVSGSQKYQFVLRLVQNGPSAEASIRWNTAADTGAYILPQLPPGTHKVVWTVKDTCGHADTCSYLFTIVGDYPSPGFTGVAFHFPADALINPCTFPLNAPVLEILNPGNLPLVVEEEWENFGDILPDACYKVHHIWMVYNSETVDPTKPWVHVPNPNPSPLTSSPLNLPGPIVAAPASPAPWTSTVVKVNPTDPAATNYSSFWNIRANGFRYDQIIKVIDTVPPVIHNCPVQALTISDSTSNDTTLWNAPYWLDHHTAGHDLPESPVDLSITASDACSGVNTYIYYLLFLDLDQDGQPETVISSNYGPAAGMVQFGNINTPNYNGGVLQKFDQRMVPDSGLYRFGLFTSVSNGLKTARAVWYSLPSLNQSPVMPQLPPGAHKIKWFAEDGCGYQTICEYKITVPFDSLVPTHEAGPAGFFGNIRCAPNPFQDQTFVSFELKAPETVQIRAFDATGRTLIRQVGYYSTGRQSVPLQIPGETGVVYIELQSAGGTAVQKMVRMR